MYFVRFILPLFAALSLLAYFSVPLVDQLFARWAEADTRLRSRLVYASLENALEGPETEFKNRHVDQLFTNLARDERLIGIGYCTKAGSPAFKSTGFPMEVACVDVPAKHTDGEFDQRTIRGGPVMVARFPLIDDTPASPAAAAAPASAPAAETAAPAVPRTTSVVIVHDLSFAAKRGETTKLYILGFVLLTSLLAAIITLVVARVTMQKWLSGLRDYLRTGKRPNNISRETVVLARDMQQRLRQIEREFKHSLTGRDTWSAPALFDFVKEHLPSEQLIAVSYREPYSHSYKDGKISWSTPVSGLITALEPIMRACKGTWMAVATGDADRATVDANDTVMVPPDQPSYRLKRLWLTDQEEAGFYAGFANEGIWPLCNIAYVKPRFRASDWEAYQVVNRKFADAIVAEAKTESPIIFIQDYHFALLPQMVREKLPGALIVCFWHIAWPNSEVFGILPWRQELLQGLLAADIIGFHTQFICNNFLDCVDTGVEALIDREQDIVRRGGRLCMVRPYPISIAWPEDDSAPPAAQCRRELMESLKLRADQKIIIGVERLDYIKGIPERLRAFALMLEAHPEWKDKVCFVQISPPSRSIIPAYANLDQEVDMIVEEINKKYSTHNWLPVVLIKNNYTHDDLQHVYRAADICVVSSLHDGMNLVAKEFIAARNDERGVLVLSQFAGSSRELVDALIINPYDEEGLAETMHRALLMHPDEQAARLRNMREIVKKYNVFAWAGSILGDAARLYRRRELDNMLNQINNEDNIVRLPQTGKLFR